MIGAASPALRYPATGLGHRTAARASALRSAATRDVSARGLLDGLFGPKSSMATGPAWWTKDDVAVVTGANKGIGYNIAAQLAQAGMTTIVTARNANLGEEATAKIKDSAGPSASVAFHQLDVTDPASISAFKQWLQATYPQGITALVNNAGFAYKGDTFGPQEARVTLGTNYHGVIAVTEALLPLVHEGKGRVVTVSSRSGLTSIIRDPALRNRFLTARSKSDIDTLVAEFLAAVDTRQDAELAKRGWPKSMYGISKLSVSMYCRVLSEQLKDKKIMVNACCPGWCQTDMSSWRGPKTAQEGADTPVMLALRSPQDFATGSLWGERQPLSW